MSVHVDDRKVDARQAMIQLGQRLDAVLCNQENWSHEDFWKVGLLAEEIVKIATGQEWNFTDSARYYALPNCTVCHGSGKAPENDTPGGRYQLTPEGACGVCRGTGAGSR